MLCTEKALPISHFLSTTFSKRINIWPKIKVAQNRFCHFLKKNESPLCDIMKNQNWKYFSNKGKSYVKCTSDLLLKRWLSLTEVFQKETKSFFNLPQNIINR